MIIDGETKVVGVIGDPISHSFSPIINNAAFQHLGLNYKYFAFKVSPEHLAGAIGGANKLGIKGLNVTIPHKEQVLVTLDQISEIAKNIGAVNVINFHDNEAHGYNTDGIGCIKALEEKTRIYNKKITILGAGGASRAICNQLIASNIESLEIINRNLNKAETLKENILENYSNANVTIKPIEELTNQIQETDIFINTTPIGMKGYEEQKPILEAKNIPENLIVNDIVYNPIETPLLKEAKTAEATTINGIKMLIYQAAEGIEIWTGKKAPTKIMEEKLKEVLK